MNILVKQPGVESPVCSCQTEHLNGTTVPIGTRILHLINASRAPGYKLLPFFVDRRCLMPSVAGLFSNLPFLSKREPWQEQSQECSALFQCSAQPRCGHRGLVGRSRLDVASRPLTNSCLCIMLRWGEKR